MSTTFGRIGRAFLIAAAVSGTAAFVALLLLGAGVTAMVLGIITLVTGIQGVVWTLIQARMFGRPSVLAEVAAHGRPTGAVITRVRTTSSSIGAHPVMKLTVTTDGTAREHCVLVPIHYVVSIRPGLTLPVRIDREHPRVLVVEWDLVP
ncbi:hypothetical protein [Pseudonocardia abyssalis]|uniref:Uncharacterized protein n=1 Tax=Pseudonocardia abyssalis TaxID=2792008 RepID=A0ABS6UW54_9PSEU|nr:hypothetical protein [Pseudonocardia abyssalis]MBW0117732.1 hypothetical protein [Pseudonocardia abyssalis]MBW0135929.1 hypothetical protein [Pseudonocardia abyssalis]